MFGTSQKLLTSFAAALVVTLGAGCADLTDTAVTRTRPADLSAVGERAINVMSRNLYLGASLDPVLAITNPNEVPFAIAQTWAKIVASNFPARAEALADEIVAGQPHLIGLQEATIYRRQTPSDFVLGNRTKNASVVVYDFVEILLAELAERGLDYRVVARVVNTDLEFPMYTGRPPLPFDDIRYTDQDVILARADVAINGSYGGNFAAFVPLNIGGLTSPLLRGWVAVDAQFGDEQIRFANTHLEVQSFRPIQEAQARELVAALAGSPFDVILVGDLNSAANDGAPVTSKTASYQIMRDAGFADLWLRGNGHDEGLTCCHASDLSNTENNMTQRIDFVMINQGTSHFVGGVQMDVIGEAPADRINGLWPSDHAGLIARLLLPAR